MVLLGRRVSDAGSEHSTPVVPAGGYREARMPARQGPRNVDKKEKEKE
eukprot:gene55085-18449_t